MGAVGMCAERDETSGWVYICTPEELTEGSWRRINVLYEGVSDSVVVLRYQGAVQAFRNLCVHMPRSLDGEDGNIFDPATGHLRCSMHGIVYSPETGESLSDICRGKKLTSVRVIEHKSKLYLKDKRVKPDF